MELIKYITARLASVCMLCLSVVQTEQESIHQYGRPGQNMKTINYRDYDKLWNRWEKDKAPWPATVIAAEREGPERASLLHQLEDYQHKAA